MGEQNCGRPGCPVTCRTENQPKPPAAPVPDGARAAITDTVRQTVEACAQAEGFDSFHHSDWDVPFSTLIDAGIRRVLPLLSQPAAQQDALRAALRSISQRCYEAVMRTPLEGHQPMHSLAAACKQDADAALADTEDRQP